MSDHEQHVVNASLRFPATDGATRDIIAHLIQEGNDPFGTLFCKLRPAADRRAQGAYFTPPALVAPMVDWALAQQVGRLIDAGCGSGRFAAAVVRRDPNIALIAVDVDPTATLLTRAVLSVLRARRAHVIQADYTSMTLPIFKDRTAFIGNPPYVRHHDLTPEAKRRVTEIGRRLGQSVSGLSGLHAHFYVATMTMAQAGDVGCFVTSAEWLDTGYGSAVRALLVNGLGGQSLHLLDPAVAAFDDAQTTAVIACFQVGASQELLRVRKVKALSELQNLALGLPIHRATLAAHERWSKLLESAIEDRPESGTVSLGSIARVHRGLVTGANSYFLMTRARSRQLGLEGWCHPAITDAREILDAGGVVRDTPERLVLLDIPKDVDRKAYPDLDRYLRWGESNFGGQTPISERYVTTHRRPWWWLGGQDPPPIIASYMARRPPAFALNIDGLALVNIGHGIYPKQPMSTLELARLCNLLNGSSNSFVGAGRTYQGGLEKFEPREMEALRIRYSVA